jgi:hypothetical protein
MFFKKICLLLLFIGAGWQMVYSQQGDFCNAVTAIMRDAPNKFRNIRGKTIDANYRATIWAPGIIVPGTISSRFVASMGLFYEGAFIQTVNKDDLRSVYDKYKGLLNSCLAPQGYTLSYSDNFYPGLRDYKKVAFMPELKEDVKTTAIPPHITMEATYSKEVGKYTIVMYIFEH